MFVAWWEAILTGVVALGTSACECQHQRLGVHSKEKGSLNRWVLAATNAQIQRCCCKKCLFVQRSKVKQSIGSRFQNQVMSISSALFSSMCSICSHVCMFWKSRLERCTSGCAQRFRSEGEVPPDVESSLESQNLQVMPQKERKPSRDE